MQIKSFIHTFKSRIYASLRILFHAVDSSASFIISFVKTENSLPDSPVFATSIAAFCKLNR